MSLSASACKNRASLGRARSLYRINDSDALKEARRFAKNAPPGKAKEARRLTFKICMERGNPDEALKEYKQLFALTKQHNDFLLRQLCELKLLSSQSHWQAERRLHALKASDKLAANGFYDKLIDRCLAQAHEPIRLWAADRLSGYPTKKFWPRIELLLKDKSSKVQHQAVQALGQRLEALHTNTESRTSRAQSNADTQEQVKIRRRLWQISARGLDFRLRATALDSLASTQDPRLLRQAQHPERLDQDFRLLLATHFYSRGRPQIWRALLAEQRSQGKSLSEAFETLFRLRSRRHKKYQEQYLKRLTQLAKAGQSDCLKWLNGRLKTGPLERRFETLQWCHSVAHESLSQAIQELCQSSIIEVKASALIAFSKVQPNETEALALQILKDPCHSLLQVAALQALDECQPIPAQDLAKWLQPETAWSLKVLALRRLCRRGGSAVDPVLKLYPRAGDRLKGQIIASLSLLEGPQVQSLLFEIATKDEDSKRRAQALMALRNSGLRSLKGIYVEALNSKHHHMDLYAAAALLYLDQNRSSSGADLHPY